LRLREPLLRMPSVRQVQIVVIPEGLQVKVVLRDEGSAQAGLGPIGDAIRHELETMGVALGVLRVEAVPRIDRAGTGAKERLVVHSRGQP